MEQISNNSFKQRIKTCGRAIEDTKSRAQCVVFPAGKRKIILWIIGKIFDDQKDQETRCIYRKIITKRWDNNQIIMKTSSREKLRSYIEEK